MRMLQGVALNVLVRVAAAHCGRIDISGVELKYLGLLVAPGRGAHSYPTSSRPAAAQSAEFASAAYQTLQSLQVLEARSEERRVGRG
jgi:hypothetical protein